MGQILDTIKSFVNPIGSAIGAGANIIGQAMANKANREEAELNRQFQADQTDKANAFNEAMMDKQNQWNLEQWNRQNEYNDPSAQVARMRAAGLNVLMTGIDGTGNAGDLAGSAASSAGVPNGSMAQYGNVAASLDPLTAAQVAELSSRARNNNQDADYKAALTQTENMIRENKVEFAGVQVDLANSNIRLNNQQISNLSQQIVESNQRIAQMNEQIRLSWANYDLDKKKLCFEQSKQEFTQWLEAQKLDQHAREIAIAAYDNETRRLLADSQIDQNDWQNLLIQAQTQTEKQKRYNLVSEQYNIEADTTAKNIKNNLDRTYGERERKADLKLTRARTANVWVNTAGQTLNTITQGLQLAYGKGFQLAPSASAPTGTPFAQQIPPVGYFQ